MIDIKKKNYLFWKFNSLFNSFHLNYIFFLKICWKNIFGKFGIRCNLNTIFFIFCVIFIITCKKEILIIVIIIVNVIVIIIILLFLFQNIRKIACNCIFYKKIICVIIIRHIFCLLILLLFLIYFLWSI